MKTFRWVAPIVALALAVPALAQTDPVIAENRARLATQLEAAVRSKLPLSQNEARVFWPLYAEYRADAASASDRAFELLEGFIAAYSTLDDARAATLLTDWLSVQQQQLDVRRSWMDRFLDQLPARTVMRFFQMRTSSTPRCAPSSPRGFPW